jgi:hypothetical protein
LLRGEILLHPSFEEARFAPRTAHWTVDELRVPVDPQIRSAQRRIRPTRVLLMKNRVVRYVDVVVQLRIEVQPKMILFRGFSDEAEE